MGGCYFVSIQIFLNTGEVACQIEEGTLFWCNLICTRISLLFSFDNLCLIYWLTAANMTEILAPFTLLFEQYPVVNADEA
jgi:hypothetical protein